MALNLQRPSLAPGISQAARSVADAAMRYTEAQARSARYFPPYLSTNLPPITDDWLYHGISISDQSKPAWLMPGTPNAWTYADGTPV